MTIEPPKPDHQPDTIESDDTESTAPPPTESLEHTPSSGSAGISKRIGQYHIKRVIGSGGMGTVYEAVQEKPRRTVALKLMKHGIASRSALRRFEYESQILGRLRHPGIAQIYEAGTHRDDSGTVPFFAMEYIVGAKPVTKYAAAKKLGIRQKLELFAQVCDAIHHGHQKGIVHRDLKPSNILVDSSGQVKIIDFGVARSTDSDMAVTTLQTDVGQLIGTLQYMSPEQCAADPHDIDTRSDVYALGIILYEMLGGRLPYDLTATPVYELPRVIREVSVAHLGTLDKALRGDVETIVEKALEKDRERRYQSALALADDIERHLKHEPILARPPSVTYRFSKFVRRQRVPLVVVSALLLVLALAVRFKIEAQQAALEIARLKIEAQEVAVALVRAEDHAQRAKLLTLSKQYRAAWEECNRALQLNPENSLALRTKGHLLLMRGEFEAAQDVYDRGLQPFETVRLLPEDFHNRGRVHQLLGNYNKALADHDRAIALAPDVSGRHGSQLYVSRGLTRALAGDIDEAIKDLTHAPSLDPTWTLQCSLWIWEMRMLRGEPGDQQAAEAALATAAAAETGDPFDKSYVDVCRGDLGPAEALAAAKTDDQRFFMNYYLGARALVEGRREDAKNRFEACVASPVYEYSEYDLAQGHLRRLLDGPAP